MKSTLRNWIAIVLTVSMLSPALLSAQVQLQGPRGSAEQFSGVVYGPIDQNDTLWRIATRYKQDSPFSVYQTMLAIYELNPQAFENGNFNTMVSGATLQLPSDRFIARMDPQRARAKAEADDRAFGRPNSVQPEEVLAQAAAQPTEPEVPLVNQQDLASTKQELQQQLNSLNRQQAVKFDEVKQQVASSIESVQALLDENRRLYERLDQVNTDISDLRGKVEGEVQDQIDQQLALQKEIIDLVKQAEQRQLDREAQSFLNILSNPVVAIGLSSLFTLGLLAIIGFWLLRRPSTAKQEASADNKQASVDIVDDELVIGEMDDDDDADDLMAALEQDMGGDDILSSDLEDGLDELGIGDDFDDADDMLVPDEKNKQTDKAKAQTIDEDVSFDTDAISLDDDDFDNQEIDLNPKETASEEAKADSKTEVVEDLTSDLDLDDFDVSNDGDETDFAADLAEQAGTAGDTDSTKPPSEAETPAVADEGAQETDSTGEVDEAVDTDDEDGDSGNSEKTSNKLASVTGDAPEGVPLDESASLDEDAIEQIENTINETTEEFDKLSEELLDELENGPGETEEDEAPVVDATPPASEPASKPTPEPASESEVETETESEPEPDTQAQSDIEQIDANSQDALSESSDAEHAESENIDNEIAPDTAETESQPEPELEPELEPEPQPDSESEPDTTPDSDKETDELGAEIEDLSDDILSELEDEQASEELDDLLEQFTENDLDNAQGAAQDVSADDQGDSIDLSDDIDSNDASQEPNDDTDALANELLSELENDSDDDDADADLDALLNEFAAKEDEVEIDSELTPNADAQETPSTETSTESNTDAFLDDIPSLSDMGRDDADAPSSKIEDGASGSQADSSETEQEGPEKEQEQDLEHEPSEHEASEQASPLDEDRIDDVSDAMEDTQTSAESLDETSIDEDDVLADLPGLDDWLGDEELEKDLEDYSNKNESDDDIDLLADIEGADFEDLLSEISDDGKLSEDDLNAFDEVGLSDEAEDKPKATDGESESKKDATDDLTDAELDIDSLLKDEDEIDGFVNVDDLLSESEALTPLEDDDVEFNLEKSLDRMSKSTDADADAKGTDDEFDASSNEVDQSSNLDLAQVYIDMDDFEAAKEVLDEVIANGSSAQIAEAKELLAQMK